MPNKKSAKPKSATKKRTPTAEIPKRPDDERRLRQATRLANVMRVQELLLGRGKWNVRSLAAELECSEKTVQRYLAVLEMAGVPYFYDSHEKCYRVRPGFKFPVVNLSSDELLGQATATAVTKATGLSTMAAATPATRKIAAVSSQEVADLLADAEAVMGVLNLKLADHSKHQEMIRTVQWALIQGKQVSGLYASPYKDKPVRLALHPYRLCLVNQAWYLIARSMDDKVPKTYRIARFQSLRMIDFQAERPERFDIDKFFGNAWAVFRGKETFDVELEFTPNAGPLVTETVWHKTQQAKRLPDGRVILSFRVDGLEEIVWWVLSWSGRVKVIQPAKLREMVVAKLQQALEMNRD